MSEIYYTTSQFRVSVGGTDFCKIFRHFIRRRIVLMVKRLLSFAQTRYKTDKNTSVILKYQEKGNRFCNNIS